MAPLRHPLSLRFLPPAGGAAVRARMPWDRRRAFGGKRIDDAGAGTFTIFS